MHKLNKILFPVDLSPCSAAAARYAFAIAKAFGATIEAIHAYVPPPYVSPGVMVQLSHDSRESLATYAMRELEDELRSFLERRSLPGVPISSQVMPGSAYECIMETIEGGGYDLVVMGTHGYTGIKHFLLGSVTQRVVRHSDIPVMTIRHDGSEEDEREITLKRILVPVDFSSGSRAAFELARYLAKRLDAALDVVHVYYTPKGDYGRMLVKVPADQGMRALGEVVETQARAELDAFIGQIDDGSYPIQVRLTHGKPYARIISLVEEQAHDLVVIGTHGRTGLSRLVMGSVTEKVVRFAPCPVVTTHAPELTDDE